MVAMEGGAKDVVASEDAMEGAMEGVDVERGS
jgi:hypothetical protein